MSVISTTMPVADAEYGAAEPTRCSLLLSIVRLPKKLREMVPIKTSRMRERLNRLKSQWLIGKT